MEREREREREKQKKMLFIKAEERISNNLPISLKKGTNEFQILAKHLGLLFEQIEIYKEDSENSRNHILALNQFLEQKVFDNKAHRDELYKLRVSQNKIVEDLKNERDHFKDRTNRLEEVLTRDIELSNSKI